MAAEAAVMAGAGRKTNTEWLAEVRHRAFLHFNRHGYSRQAAMARSNLPTDTALLAEAHRLGDDPTPAPDPTGHPFLDWLKKIIAFVMKILGLFGFMATAPETEAVAT